MSRDPKPLTTVRQADGSALYVTIEGDVLDHLCWRHYGREWDTTEAVLLANPGLANNGMHLAADRAIVFPYLPPPSVQRKERRRLFD